MVGLWSKTLNITANPSGAVTAAKEGNIIMVVDVIDMSTTAEAALEEGIIEVLGASPDYSKAPVTLNPEKIGYFAGKKAIKYETEVIIAAEPRFINIKQPPEKIKKEGIQKVIKGIEKSGATVNTVIPNLGKDCSEIVDFKNRILVIVSSCGGTVYDAAYNHGAIEVITGTIARTLNMKGSRPAKTAAKRAINLSAKFQSGISVVAASSNSLEDMLAANYIADQIIREGFLELD